ncbi:prolyl oligopeptidase family serine peptidase [Crocinitomix catalasitica]|nr:prolyl oligopeptidase family serine peptidase [Crocinitomix catalasitica]
MNRGFNVVAIDKIGIAQDRINEAQFLKYDFRQTRVNSTHQTIEYLLEENLIDSQNIFIVGYSEGGDIAAQVASEREDISGVILIACGGYSPLQEAEIYSKKGLIKRIFAKRFKKKAKKILSDPQSEKMWMGHTYKRWASYLNEAPIFYLQKTSIPILSIHGTKDNNCPVESSLYLRDEFLKMGRENYELTLFKGCNHSFICGNKQDKIGDAIKILFEWTNQHTDGEKKVHSK